MLMEVPPDEAGGSSPELHFLMKMSQLLLTSAGTTSGAGYLMTV